jgi:hypothetical protein
MSEREIERKYRPTDSDKLSGKGIELETVPTLTEKEIKRFFTSFTLQIAQVHQDLHQLKESQTDKPEVMEAGLGKISEQLLGLILAINQVDIIPSLEDSLNLSQDTDVSEWLNDQDLDELNLDKLEPKDINNFLRNFILHLIKLEEEYKAKLNSTSQDEEQAEFFKAQIDSIQDFFGHLNSSVYSIQDIYGSTFSDLLQIKRQYDNALLNPKNLNERQKEFIKSMINSIDEFSRILLDCASLLRPLGDREWFYISVAYSFS